LPAPMTAVRNFFIMISYSRTNGSKALQSFIKVCVIF